MFREDAELIVAHLDLPATTVGLAGTQSRKPGQSRGRQGDKEEDTDRHRVGSGGRENAAARLQTMEEHVYDGARDGCQRAEPQSPHGRDHEDAQQKDHAEDVSAGGSHEQIHQTGLGGE